MEGKSLPKNQPMPEYEKLIPDVVLHKTNRYWIVKNADGAIEIINAYGNVVKNLGKEI